MRSDVHYDPVHTASYAVYKITIRVMHALAAARRHPLLYLDISSAFTLEEYKHHKPVYIKQLPRADGSLSKPGCPIGRLRPNLYGTKMDVTYIMKGWTNNFVDMDFNPRTDIYVYTQKQRTL